MADDLNRFLQRRVRAVVRGESAYYDDKGRPAVRKHRIVVTGTAVAAERDIGSAVTYLIVDGYGRVDADAVRLKRWWHRG